MQTEEEFLAELTQGTQDDPVDRVDEYEQEDESEESEAEDLEEQESERPLNGGRRSQGMHSTGGRRPDVEKMVYALKQEGETKARLPLCSH